MASFFADIMPVVIMILSVAFYLFQTRISKDWNTIQAKNPLFTWTSGFFLPLLSIGLGGLFLVTYCMFKIFVGTNEDGALLYEKSYDEVA